ncbi:MAG: 30S ribosomal protein S18 [bacterium]
MNKNNKTNNTLDKKRYCYFCVNQIDEIDYKDTTILRRFISSYAKIVPPRRSNVCAKHQRKLKTAIKRARVMALLPITTK